MPKYRECSVDEYLSKRQPVSRDGIVYRAAGAPKTFNAEERSQVFVMTDESVDSYGDIVKAGGADLYRFEKNPIALLNHRSDLILGSWSEVAKKPQRIEGKVTLAKEGTAPHVDMAYNLMGQGILRGASIGFMPTKLEMRLDDDGDPMWCYLIHEWELYECSVVSIPANPAALARSAGNSDELRICRDYLEEVLDNWVKSPEGLLLPRAEFEKAYKVTTEKMAADAPTPAVGPTAAEVDAFVAKAIEANATLEENDAGFKAHAGGKVVAELKTGLAGVNLHIDVMKRVDDGKAAKAAAPTDLDDFKAFLAKEVNDGDELHVYYKLEGRITIEKGVTVRHPDTDKIGSFEFRSAMASEHRAAIAARLLEIADAKAAQAENKPETIDVASLATEITKSQQGLLDGLFEKLSTLFRAAPPATERVEPEIVPEPEVKAPDEATAEAALARAAAVRERLLQNGRIAA